MLRHTRPYQNINIKKIFSNFRANKLCKKGVITDIQVQAKCHK